MNYIKDSVFYFFGKLDLLLWGAVLSALIYSSLLIISMQRAGDYNYFKPQLIAVIVGLGAAVLTSAADYRLIIERWYIPAAVAAVLAASVFLFGIRVNGTDDTAWITLPGGFTVQPSEFIKICFILTLSKHLSYLSESGLIKKLWAFLTLLLHAAVPMAAIHLQGDDGTVLIFLMVFLIMSFTAGVSARYFVILGGGVLTGVPLIWRFFLNDEHRNRMLALFDLEGSALTGYGWQQYQGKLSIAGGGLFGRGLFSGARVSSGVVPEQENDFILTVAGEELGFVGCVTVIALLLGIALLILRGAARTSDFRGRLVCAGVFAVIASQTVINIGMVLGLFPVIGITLPLFSAGGSSAVSVLICVGLVQSVRSHDSKL